MKRWLNNKKKNTTIVYYEGKIGNYIDNTLGEEKKKKKKTLEFYQGLSFITAILGYLLSLITNPWISAIGMLIAISSFLVIAWSRYKYEPDDFHEYMLVLGVYFAVLGGILVIDYRLSIPYVCLGASGLSIVIVGFLLAGASYLTKRFNNG